MFVVYMLVVRLLYICLLYVDCMFIVYSMIACLLFVYLHVYCTMLIVYVLYVYCMYCILYVYCMYMYILSWTCMIIILVCLSSRAPNNSLRVCDVALFVHGPWCKCMQMCQHKGARVNEKETICIFVQPFKVFKVQPHLCSLCVCKCVLVSGVGTLKSTLIKTRLSLTWVASIARFDSVPSESVSAKRQSLLTWFIIFTPTILQMNGLSVWSSLFLMKLEFFAPHIEVRDGLLV